MRVLKICWLLFDEFDLWLLIVGITVNPDQLVGRWQPTEPL